jgi:hypothetical protein
MFAARGGTKRKRILTTETLRHREDRDSRSQDFLEHRFFHSFTGVNGAERRFFIWNSGNQEGRTRDFSTGGMATEKKPEG